MLNSIGFKILLIGVLVVLLLIPLSLIEGLTFERSHYRNQAVDDIANSWSGSQTLTGPIMALPYQIREIHQIWDDDAKVFQSKTTDNWHIQYILPEHLDISAQIVTEQRSRGIYDVPVYNSDIRLHGEFSGFSLSQYREGVNQVVAVGNPQLIVGISDVRGLSSLPSALWEGDDMQFEAGTQTDALGSGMHIELPQIDDVNNFTAVFDVAFKLRGSQAFQMLAMGEQTTVRLQSGWPHPRFFGHFLPLTHDISTDGFTAEWDVTAFATNALEKLQRCAERECIELNQSAFGVDFIQPVDVYTQSERAVKYGILFIVLTFAAFFLIEVMARMRMHVIQYGLVGCALAMFYLLLLSLAEHMPFIWAYLIANLGCAGLLGIYLTTALQSTAKGWGYAASVSALYWMLFAILRSEDFALLMGCLLLFAALAVIMLLTRKVDWYQVSQQLLPAGQRTTPQ